MNNERINDALQVLYEEGLKGYDQEYQDMISRHEAIGKAIAYVENGWLPLAQIAYEALESWNCHSVCSLLDWAFPQLHPSQDPRAEDYFVTLQQIKRVIDRPQITVFTDWDKERLEYNTARYRVEVVLTKLDDPFN